MLAVGDLLPLALAFSSGAPFGFIGTPKSDYTWRSGPGRSISDRYHRLKGSEWDPWEWALMRSRRCRLVAVRDRLTARGLRQHAIDALAPGNPMMDGLRRDPVPAALCRCRRVLLLCGSRMPEALDNFTRLLGSLTSMHTAVPLAVLVAVGSQPPLSDLERVLMDQATAAVFPVGITRGSSLLGERPTHNPHRPWMLRTLGWLGGSRIGHRGHRHGTAGGPRHSGRLPARTWSPVPVGIRSPSESAAGRRRTALSQSTRAGGAARSTPGR